MQSGSDKIVTCGTVKYSKGKNRYEINCGGKPADTVLIEHKNEFLRGIQLHY